ncbi:polyphosphate kinase 2 family protein [Nibrella saemangeumensis]|uniref:Polyphosphate kinase 2 family protein n=1 Tax=Nibrella saemangeumensis TaxID=1084526 RepID=A0ABP8MFB7_9BACT
MKKKSFSSADLRFDGSSKGAKKFSSKNFPTIIEPLYASEEDWDRQMFDLTARMDQLQNTMHADEHYGLVVLFQAMDAAGKDSSIRHVFKGLNPSRFRITAFKKPEQTDLKHEFLWRFWRELPERGTIGIFNRSYYEETLVLRIHPERLKEQMIPENLIPAEDQLWKERFADIVCFEDYLYRNGFPVIKFYLHVAKEEQGQRLINRLSDPEKQWKLSESDLKEREHWDEYMTAYEEVINQTATKNNPWYLIPSDDRKNQQLIIARIMVEILESLPIEFPQRDEKEAQKLIKIIQKQDK